MTRPRRRMPWWATAVGLPLTLAAPAVLVAEALRWVGIR